MSRQERRAREHGKDQGQDVQDNLRTQAENEALAGPGITGADEPTGPDESSTGETQMTNYGAGGAVESRGRQPQHEAAHRPNVPNAG